KKQGQSCTADADCVTGQCADGVCCDRDCTGACEACSAAGACGFVTGAPHAGHPACTGGSGTRASTSRRGSAARALPGAETSCRTQTCSGSTLTLAAACNSAGACPGVMTSPCAPFACGTNNACLGGCTTNSQCTGTNVACQGGSCSACGTGTVVCP